MNLSRILLILVLVLINKAFTKNVGPNIAPLELKEEIRNDLDQKELNEYPTDRGCGKSDFLCSITPTISFLLSPFENQFNFLHPTTTLLWKCYMNN